MNSEDSLLNFHPRCLTYVTNNIVCVFFLNGLSCIYQLHEVLFINCTKLDDLGESVDSIIKVLVPFQLYCIVFEQLISIFLFLVVT